MTNRALFDLDGDTGDAGFLASFGETLRIKLRARTGVSSWVVQVWSPTGFGYGIPILDNPPRASKNAPLLTLTGLTSGQSVVGSLTGEVTTPIPASGINSWLIRSVVNGGLSGNPPRPDPSLVHERLVVTTSTVLRKPTATETNQYEVDSWAGVICDLVDAFVGSSGGLIVGGTPLPGYTITAGAMAAATWSLGPGFFVVGTHTLRDGLPDYQMQVGVLVLTLDDGIVWQVASVGPVVFAVWPGAGGVTSFKTRTGAVVPAVGDYAASQVNNDSSTVAGTRVSNALDNLKTSITALVTGVSSVFGRAGAIVSAFGDYAASQITNDSSVAGTGVKGALNTLLASLAAGPNPFKSTFHVDPTFSGSSTGSESNPFPSYTAAIAAAVSAGLSSARFVQAPGTNSTESFSVPANGNWEIASDFTGSGRDVATVITKISGSISCTSANLVLTNIWLTGNITGNATNGVSGSTLTLKNTLIAGAITLTATTGFWLTFMNGDMAWPNGNVGCVLGGAVSIAGNIAAFNTYFGSTISVTSVNRFINCRFNGNITVAGPSDQLVMLGCTWPNNPLTITGAGTTGVVMDGYTASSKFALSGCVLQLRNNVTPFRATFYVDPLFVTPTEGGGGGAGGSTGSPSNPFTTIAAAIAASSATGAVIEIAPGASITETFAFPTAGKWELRCKHGSRATITGDITCSSSVQARYLLTNIDVVGNVLGTATSATSVGSFLTLTTSSVSGTLTLSGSGAGFWFCQLRGVGTNFFAFGGSINGNVSVVGQLFSNNWLFGASFTATSISLVDYSRFQGGASLITCAISLGMTNCVFTAAPTFVGPCVFGLDGYTRSKASGFSLTSGATVTLFNVVDPSGITQGGATGVNTQALMWNGSIWAPFSIAALALVSSVFTRTGAVVAAVGDYAASQINNDSAVTGATVKLALNNLNSAISALVTGVSSFKTRTGAVVPAAGDYAASQVNNDSATVSGTHVSDSLDALKALIVASVTGVSTVFGRAGAVVAAVGDYAATKINNDSSVAGVHVSDALNNLSAAIAAITSAVASWNGRTGAVVPVSGDYATALITNDSSVVGATAKAALNTLLGSVNSVTSTVSGLVTGVSTVFGRAGAVVAAVNDYAASQVANDSSVAGTGVKGALNTLLASLTTTNSTVASLVTGVSSVFTRTGAIVALAGDYAASKINNDSATVLGTHVSDALDNLLLQYESISVKVAGYTVALSDVRTLIQANSSSSLAFTIPTNATVAFKIGSRFTVQNINTGSVTIGGAVGVTVRGPVPLPATQFVFYDVEKTGTNTWDVTARGILTAQDIVNASVVSGPTVSVALGTLDGRISSLTSSDIANASSLFGTTISDVFDSLNSNEIENSSTVVAVNVSDALDVLKQSTLFGNIRVPIVQLGSNSGWTWATFATGRVWEGLGIGDEFFGPIGPIPPGATLTGIVVRIKPATGHGGMPSKPRLKVYKNGDDGVSTAVIGSLLDSSASVPVYEAVHTITSTGWSGIVGSDQCSVYWGLTDESGTNHLPGMRIVSLEMILT